MARINHISITANGRNIPATTDTADITAENEVVFTFDIQCESGESCPNRIAYNLYTHIPGRTEAVLSADNHADLTGGRLTVMCLEQYAGATLAISFALDGDNPVQPCPGIVVNTVKYLNIRSALSDAPKIVNVYWAENEAAEYGHESAQRAEICENEDAFLHIHTRGLFGKCIKVDLLGSIFSHGSYNVLQSRTYTVQDNVLSITIPMSQVSHTSQSIIGLKAVVSSPEIQGSKETLSSLLLRHDLSAHPTRASANLGTSKFVIGDPPQRPIRIPLAPPKPLSEELNVVVGTLSFLSGTGTLHNTPLKASGETGSGCPYYTYPLDTYELRLQHFIDAGIVTEDEVIETIRKTASDGKKTEEKCPKATNIYKTTYDKVDIYGFREQFMNTVRDRLSINGRQDDGLDYARLRLLHAAIRKSGTQPIDSREFCRSAWQLQSVKTVKGIKKTIYYNRWKQLPFRYSTNHECPPGAFYVVPCQGLTYLAYVGDTPISTIITHWTCTTLTDDRTEREEIMRPNDLRNNEGYTPCPRDGIAFHRGRCVSAVGCITLNVGYKVVNAKTMELDFFNRIFSGDQGEYLPKASYTTSAPTLKTGAALKLHLIMIEERRAVLRNDASTKDCHPMNRYKGE